LLLFLYPLFHLFFTFPYSSPPHTSPQLPASSTLTDPSFSPISNPPPILLVLLFLLVPLLTVSCASSASSSLLPPSLPLPTPPTLKKTIYDTLCSSAGQP
uniref:Ovule protein n=1 Tax=Schistocephalus solidus TaxID=70667 RepID=A0A183TME2_SCHSO